MNELQSKHNGWRPVIVIAGWLVALALVLVSVQALTAQEGEPGTGPLPHAPGAGEASDEVDTILPPAGTGITVYLPIVYRDLLRVTLYPIGRPTSAHQWTLYWSDAGPDATNYQLHESNDPDFATYTTYDLGPVTAALVTHPPSLNNVYYYRVRATGAWGEGYWSNVETAVGPYGDYFDDSSSGWAIRRQDTDDVENSSFYASGNFVMNIGGSWDYAIGSPVIAAPAPPYRLETSVSLSAPANQHSYGLIFGGDWNGDTCPNGDYSSCFNHYYRLNVVYYFGSSTTLRYNLKRIDTHDPGNNSGSGVTLIDFTTVNVGNALEYNEWAIEVTETGEIRVYVDDALVGTATDSTYVNDPYFGVFASDDITPDAEPHFDWYTVTYLDSAP